MGKLKNQDIIGIACVVFTVLWSFLSIAKILQYRYICAGDTFWHYSNEIHLLRSLQDGQGIFSCFPKGMGTPLLTFYQPLLYLIVAAIHLITMKCVSVYTIHNILVVVLFAMYPVSVYYFARSFGLSKLKSGLISIFSLFPISACGHTLDACLSMGVHTQIIGTLLTPVILGSVNRLSYDTSRRSSLIYTVSLLFMILGHAVYTLQLVYIIPLYLVMFLIWNGWKRFLSLFWRIVKVSLIAVILASFWLIPFIVSHSEYESISQIERSGSGVYHSMTVTEFIQKTFSGQLLDNSEISDREVEPALRWSDNARYNRFYLFTIMSFIGLILFLMKARAFRDFYLLLLFFWGIFLFLGLDDIPWLRYLPFIQSFQNIRSILIIELMCAVFAGTFVCTILIFALDMIRKRSSGKSNIILRKVVAILIVCGIITAMAIPLFERYRTAQRLIARPVQSKADKLQRMFASEQDKENFPRILFAQDTVYRSFADCFFLNNINGLDNFAGNSLAWFVNDLSHRIIYSSQLLDLFGIKYVVFDQDDVAGIDEMPYRLLEDTPSFDLYGVTEDTPFFFVPQKEPVLVYCSDMSWYHLNKEWLKRYLKAGDPPAHLIRITDGFDDLINPDAVSSIMLLNFPDSEENKQRYIKLFKQFIDNGGVVYSNRPLWNLPVKEFVGIETLSDVLDSSVEYKSNTTLDTITSKWYTQTVRYSASQPQFVIAKTIYYKMWKAFFDENPLKTFCVSPGFVAIFADDPAGEINLSYVSSKMHSIFFIIALVVLIITFIIMRKSSTEKFNPSYDMTLSVNRGLCWAGRILILACVMYLGVLFFQQTYHKQVPLLYPLQSQKNLSSFEVTLHWTRLRDTDTYSVQVSEQPDFSLLSASIDSRKENYLPLHGLKESCTYYWQVKGTDGKWSRTHRFSTGIY